MGNRASTLQGDNQAVLESDKLDESWLELDHLAQPQKPLPCLLFITSWLITSSSSSSLLIGFGKLWLDKLERRKTLPDKLRGLVRNCMPISARTQGEWLRPGLFPVVSSLDGLLALFRTDFELVIKTCTINENRHQRWYKEHSQSMKNADPTKEILTIGQAVVVPRECPHTVIPSLELLTTQNPNKLIKK
ncbi:hypothetical protein Acr_27g0000930 [Actinidia rufa]|uniref:Uncharacterized protein n=1 Tax=Actinidia rufa TaxID=165716 RepID=A0A7J0H6I1_9ERIC|nr:hypothetical protein Acr_27g0000930 [Actinidia rufa]